MKRAIMLLASFGLLAVLICAADTLWPLKVDAGLGTPYHEVTANRISRALSPGNRSIDATFSDFVPAGISTPTQTVVPIPTSTAKPKPPGPVTLVPESTEVPSSPPPPTSTGTVTTTRVPISTNTQTVAAARPDTVTTTPKATNTQTVTPTRPGTGTATSKATNTPIREPATAATEMPSAMPVQQPTWTAEVTQPTWTVTVARMATSVATYTTRVGPEPSSSLLDRLTRDKPSIWGNKGFYILLGALYLMLLGLFLMQVLSTLKRRS